MSAESAGRPELSASKQGTNSHSASFARTCLRCGKVWPESAGATLNYVADGDAVRCFDQRYCRARQLNAKLDLKLFAKTPREYWKARIDVRPADWKDTGWETHEAEMDRVEACIIYHSWCFPVCMEYACVLRDDDSEVAYNKYSPGPVYLKECDIAAYMNVARQTVNRGVKALVARKRLRVDEDGRYYPVPYPGILTVPDRWTLAMDELAGVDGASEYRGIPKQFRERLADLAGGLPENISSEMMTELRSFCSSFNDSLRNIRTLRDSAIEDACTRYAIILSRDFKTLSSTTTANVATIPDSRAVNPSHESVTLPDIPGHEEATGSQDREKAYEAGLGKGALAKLPPQAERPTLIALSDAIRPYAGIPDEKALQQLIRDCQRRAADCTLDEICFWVDEKGLIAKGKKSPLGFLLTAVPNCFMGDTFQRWRADRAQVRRGEVEAERQAELRATELLQQREAEERKHQRLVEHPEECPFCTGAGWYPAAKLPAQLRGSKDPTIPIDCGCPAGDARRLRGGTQS